MDNCIFCNIKNKENEIILFENDYCICVDQQQKENMRPNNKYARNGRATGIVLRENKIMFMQQIVSGR